MGQFSIGQSVRRREDPRLLTGRGRYFDDLKLADQLHAAIVRSPHAHADIKSIDARAALQMPGVHAVLTGEDYEADGLGTHAVDGALQEARRQPDVSAAPAGDRHRSRAACRLSGRGGGRRYARPRPRRRRARRGRLRAAARRGVGRAMRSSQARRSSTTIARTTRPISTRPATRPRPTRRSPTPRTWSSSGSSSTASPPTRSSRAASPANTTRHRPLHAALRLPAAVAVPQRHRRDHDEDSGERSFA